MRRPQHRLLLPSLASTLAILAACGGDAPLSPQAPPSAARALSPGTHLQYGTPTKLGEGMVRSYVILDEKAGRRPIELGVAIDARTMEGTLPDAGQLQMRLALPAQAPAPYDFVLFDWNSHGHAPPTVYDIPHFDFHFYLTPESEVDAISPANPNFAAEANNLPTGGELPPFYIIAAPPPLTPADIAVPGMGVHWDDVRSPQLQHLFGNPAGWAPFDKTFIYGSWNGEITFMEPMVTRAYLLGRPDVTTPVPVPAIVPESGWYPSAYRVYYDATKREYRVAIVQFTWNDA